MAGEKLPRSGHDGPALTDEEFAMALTGGAHKDPKEFEAWVRAERRRVAYENGRYSFTVPPVVHGHWSVADWMKHIDACDGWFDKQLRNPL